jgi:hypothetical protein
MGADGVCLDLCRFSLDSPMVTWCAMHTHTYKLT